MHSHNFKCQNTHLSSLLGEGTATGRVSHTGHAKGDSGEHCKKRVFLIPPKNPQKTVDSRPGAFAFLGGLDLSLWTSFEKMLSRVCSRVSRVNASGRRNFAKAAQVITVCFLCGAISVVCVVAKIASTEFPRSSEGVVWERVHRDQMGGLLQHIARLCPE